MELLKKGSFLVGKRGSRKSTSFQVWSEQPQTFHWKPLLFISYTVARLPLAFVWIRKYTEEESQKFPVLWFRSIMYFRSHCKPLKGLNKGKRSTNITSYFWKDWGNYSERVSFWDNSVRLALTYWRSTLWLPLISSNLLKAHFYISAWTANEKAFICLKGQGRNFP